MPAQTPATKAETTALPSIEQLFRDSWLTFKQSALNLFVTMVLMWVGMLVILLVMGIIVFAVAGTSGLLGALKGDTSAMAAAGVSTFLIISVLFIIFMVLVFIASFTVQAAMLLLVAESGSKPELIPTIKRGMKFVLPLFGIGIVTGIVVAGGALLLVIPGIIFGLLFAFAPLEIVLNGQSVTNAMRRSVYIVKNNFLEIFIRLAIFWFIQIIISIIIPLGISTASRSALGSLISIFYSLFVQIPFSWFSLAYLISLYKHASGAAAKDQTASLKWIVIISIIGWIFAILFSGVIIGILSTTFKDSINKSMQKSSSSGYQYSGTTSGSEISQVQADTLGSDVFTAVNDYRSVKGLAPFEQDMHLCAYAQRRLEQLDKLGKFDDYKGYYEDMANKDMNNAYFKDYATLNEYVFGPVSNSTTANQVVANWTSGTALEENKAIVASKTFNNACVRANPEFIVIEGGKK